MNEEAIIDSYNLFVQSGYKKSLEDYKSLISSNPEALKDSYNLFVQTGYRKSLDEYKGLIGLSPVKEDVKKKEDITELPLEDGGLVQQSFKDRSDVLDISKFKEDLRTPSDVTDLSRPKVDFIKNKIEMEEMEAQKPFIEQQKQKEIQAKEEIRLRTDRERQDLLKSPEFEIALSGTDAKSMELDESEAVKYFTNLYGKYGFIFREAGIGDALEVIAPDNTIIDVDLQTFFSNEKESAKLQSFVKSKAIKPLQPVNADNQDEIDRATRVRSMRKNSMITKDGKESSLDFETKQIGGKYVVFPTLFPKSDTDNYGSNPIWWEKKKDMNAYEEALKRGEVFEFSNKEDALEFAGGSWEKINTLDAEAKNFYAKRGLDYTTYKNKFDRYEEVKDIIEFLELSPLEEKDLTQEEKEKFSSYYLNGKKRQDVSSVINELSNEADQLREIVNDSDFRDIREDFDLYLDKGFNQKAKEASSLNLIAKEKEDEVQYESLIQFGVRAEDLGKIVPKNESELKKIDNLITIYKDAKSVSQEAANKYEVAKTWLDAKADKEARAEYVENWASVSNAWESGLARGKVGNEILKMSLGLVDLDDDASIDKVAVEIIKYLQESETGKIGRAQSRFNQAKGFKEVWDMFKDDPAELSINFVSESISQMLPYGWKLIAGSTASGAAGGAIIGSVVPGAGTAAGALTGLSYGLRSGFASTSVALEYTNAVIDAVRNNGYNPMVPEELITALRDQKVWDEGKDIGLKRGISIAVVDLLSQGLAGRVFKTGKLASTPVKIASSVTERLIFDPAAEGLGELTAQLVAGQDVSGKDIFAESLGGFGNNAPAASVNMYLDARRNNNVKIANDFLDLKFMASDNTSDSRISSWANNMQNLGQISAEQNQRIQQNIGLRREARDVLNVGTGLNSFGSTKNRNIEARLMELLSAREELTSTPNRQSVFSEKISEINKEISEIATNKKLRPVNQQTILAGQGVISVTEQESATDIREGIKKYSINGKSFTKEEFLTELDKMTSRRLMNSAITVENDEETSTILKQKFDTIQEQETGEVSAQADLIDQETVAAPVETKSEPQAQIEQLRAQEQSELTEALTDADQYMVDGVIDGDKITDPAEKKIFDDIYDKYDKLITPLIEQEAATEVKQEEIVGEGVKLVIDKEATEVRGKDHTRYAIFDSNNNEVGSVSFNYREDLDGYQIENIKVSDAGTGVGTNAYRLLINQLDKPLISDSSRTRSADAVWGKLEKEGLAKFNEEQGKYFSIKPQAEPQVQEEVTPDAPKTIVKAKEPKPKVISEKKKREEIISRPAFTPTALARQWLLSGGKLLSKQSERNKDRGVGIGKGVREETGMSGIEMKQLFGVIDNKRGVPIEVAAERIYADLNPELQSSMDVQDIRNAMIEVISSEDRKTWIENQDRETSENQMSEFDQFMYDQLNEQERADFDEYQQIQSYYDYLNENADQLAEEYDNYINSETYKNYIEEIYGKDRESQEDAQDQDDGRGKKQSTDGETDSIQGDEQTKETVGKLDEILKLDPKEKGTGQKVLDYLDNLIKDYDSIEGEGLGVNIALPAIKAVLKTVRALVKTGMTLKDAISKAAKDDGFSVKDVMSGIESLGQILPIQQQYDALMSKADTLISDQKTAGIANKEIVSNLDAMIRKSEVYKNANDAQRKIMEREARFKAGVEPRKSASSGRVLGVLKDITNVSPKEKMRIIGKIRELGRDVAKDLANDIRSMAVKGQITTAQATNIISRFGKVNMLNETSVSNFVDYMADVFAKVKEKNRQSLLRDMANLVSAKAKTAKTQSGKRRSKGLDAVGQSFFAAIKPIIKAAAEGDFSTLEKIKNSIDEDLINELIIKTLNGEDLTTRERVLLDQALAYDTFADLANMDIEKIQELYNKLKDSRTESIANLKSIRIERAKKVKSMHEELSSQIKKGFGILYNADGTLKNENQLRAESDAIWESFRNLKIWDGVKKWASRYDFNTVTGVFDYFRNNLAHLGTLSNILDKGGKFFTNNVYNALNEMDNATLEGYYEQSEILNKMANKIEGITKGYKQFKSKMSDKVIALDNITDSKTGNKWRVPMNQDQAMRIYALYKNPIQRNKLIKMGFDEATMQKLENFIGPEGKQMADLMVEYFSNDYYESVNKVYQKVNDVNLGYVENYFPTQTVATNVNADMLINGNFSGIFDAETAPSLKERTDTTSDVLLGASFTDVVESHIQTMERYKAYAEGVKRINSIFKSPDVKALLGRNGTDLNNVIKNLVNHAVNPNGGAKTKNTFLDKLMTKFTGFALSFKLIQIAKQSTSFIQAFEDYNYRGKGKNRIPGLDSLMFMIDTAHLIATLPTQVKKAQRISASFRSRLEKGLDGDVYGLESGSQTFKPLGKQNTILGRAKRAFKKGAGFPTVIGDVLGVMGYMVVYNRNIANGMSQAEAVKLFNNYNATQQSRRAADKIPLQTSQDALKRSFTMFGSTTFLQINKAAQSITNIMRSLKSKKVPKTEDLRALVLNVSLANVLFVATANIAKFIDGDDEDREMALKQIKDAALGLNLLYQIPLIGGGIEVAIKRARGDRGPVGDVVNPYITVFNKIWKGINEDDLSKSLQPLVEIGIGTQVDPFIGLFNSFGEGFESENIYDMIGISKSYRPGYGTKSQSGTTQQRGMTKTQMRKSMPTLYKEIYGETDEIMKEISAEKKRVLKEAGIDYKEDDFNLED